MRNAVIALTLVLVLGALVAVLLLGGADPSAPAPGAEDPAAPVGAASAQGRPSQAGGAGGRQDLAAAAAAPASPAAAAAAAPAEGGRFLEGQVVDEQDQPVSGAWVISGVEGEPVLTDADGRFRIALLDLRTYRGGRNLVAWREGMEVAQTWAREDDPVLIRLRADAGAEVQVARYGDQAPIAGARARAVVRAEPLGADALLEQTRWIEIPMALKASDVDGAIRVPRGQDYVLWVSAEGYDDALGGLWGADDERFDGVVLLRPHALLRIGFVLADQTPFAGAQVGFATGDPVGTTDAGGWVVIPPLARGGYWSLRVVRDGLRWMEFPDEPETEMADGPLAPGTRIVVNHYPREGRLETAGRGAPADYELASAALNEDWGESAIPDPTDAAEQLLWAPVAEDGAFRLEQGWQSERTILIVRRRSDQRVVLQQETAGYGPYDLTLPQADVATLRFLSQPPELVEGAEVQLSREDAQDWASWIEAPPVQAGVSVIALEPGVYDVSITLAGRRASFELGQLRMPPAPHEQEFDLGLLRTLRGSVQAGGQPVFPCTVSLYDNQGFRMRAATDAGGRFSATGVPAGELRLRLRPGDPWLTEPGRPERPVPAGVEEHAVRIPVGFLQFTAAELGEVDRGRIRVQRLPLPEAGRSSNYWGEAPRLPSLGAAPVTVRVTPSLVRFHVQDDFHSLVPEQVEVREGQVHTVSLAAHELGLLCVRLRGQRGWFRAQVDVAASGATPPLAADQMQALRSRWESGGQPFLVRYALEPGQWGVSVRGPIVPQWSGEESEALAGEDAVWEGTALVRKGQVTTVWIDVQDGGGLAGETEHER